ncbi:hypothetical protein B0H13DRAFT_2130705 [Mycena leptocephala]|nr:hypothetical protein B0H13DRAFT_2130705 [Mycena leptocephala]
MTEYDYSEEGARRFADTIARIGHWSHLTASTPQADPFAPPTPATSGADLPPNFKRSKSKRRTRSSDRDERGDGGGTRFTRGPARPRTAPPRGDVYGTQQPPLPGLPATATTATVLPRPALARVLPPRRRRVLLPSRPGQYAPQPQPQTHHRSRCPPRRASTYPYPAPPPGSGQKGYVYHPSPGYAPPGPSPGYSSAPALQMHPALFNQPQRSPTKEVPLLKRVFGFGGGGGKRERSASRDTSTRESSRDTSGRESRGSGSRRESRDGNGKGRSTSRGRTY